MMTIRMTKADRILQLKKRILSLRKAFLSASNVNTTCEDVVMHSYKTSVEENIARIILNLLSVLNNQYNLCKF